MKKPDVVKVSMIESETKSVPTSDKQPNTDYRSGEAKPNGGEEEEYGDDFDDEICGFDSDFYSSVSYCI